jgi:hypothetical protein
MGRPSGTLSLLQVPSAEALGSFVRPSGAQVGTCGLQPELYLLASRGDGASRLYWNLFSTLSGFRVATKETIFIPLGPMIAIGNVD